ncbi:hypothetical protein GCM10009837_43060 [Streptomyces durmitorensis]|uniref:Uncharacterized protein n=1 Tax=Streptomyces durmitorensis TaxID=319947 RepID=A0ABY4Q696_9ACTN|nr:hypothetical protein [Streptomyces durmitorensis]UQT60681.1 hypothetical protein M4V62_39535 [Streptomyces durmitorensis]
MTDRLYELLPADYRGRDAQQGEPLRALLSVVEEQVGLLDEDMARMYENWFIETCQEWAVPYIGDLVGYRPAPSATGPANAVTTEFLFPRRAVAHVVRDRRRKGTLALLESLATDLAELPARAVEFYRLLSVTQPVRLLGTGDVRLRHRLRQGRTADLRRGEALDLLDGPFDTLAHTVDVRRPDSHRTAGRHNISSTGVFVWRLRSYPVSRTPALCLEDEDPHRYTFSVLGNDTPLFSGPAHGADTRDELRFPAVLRRRALARRPADQYGPGRSFEILLGDPSAPVAVPVEDISAADLSSWSYRPRGRTVAVDPSLGRILFPRDLLKAADAGVTVSYRYGFSADVGGGEYDRPLSQRPGSVTYRASGQQELQRRLAPWQDAGQLDRQPEHAVIEITDSGVYDITPRSIRLAAGHSLQLRAANRCRPVLRLPDHRTGPDALRFSGEAGSSVTLDGLLICGGAVRADGGLADVTIRHCTLVPGWGLDADCRPHRPARPSLMLIDTDARVVIEHSITGSVAVAHDAARRDPEPIRIADTIVDATSHERSALCALGGGVAQAVLTLHRATVIGEVCAHSLELAENSVFDGRIEVARRQFGCVRFCYVAPGSRTPRRHGCQPDLVDAVTAEPDRERERLRVRPAFDSTRYGTPAYGRLSATCAEEITQGADDGSEMGVFHDLYQPQRAANLRSGLAEYTPSGSDAGVIDAD